MTEIAHSLETAFGCIMSVSAITGIIGAIAEVGRELGLPIPIEFTAVAMFQLPIILTTLSLLAKSGSGGNGKNSL